MKFVRGALPGLDGERDIAVLEGDTGLCKWIEEGHRIDVDCGTFARVSSYITPESVVYDVGAFIGDHTAFYASLGPRLVLAFEAYGDACRCAVHNLSGYPNTSVVYGPVGDGRAITWDDDAEAATGDLRLRSAVAAPSGPGAKVVTHKLDDFAGPKYLPPTLIKIDVEGWEVNVLRGAEQTIKRHHPVIVCEVSAHLLRRAGTSEAELHALLTSHGYTMSDFDGNPWMPGDPRPGFDIIAEAR